MLAAHVCDVLLSDKYCQCNLEKKKEKKNTQRGPTCKSSGFAISEKSCLVIDMSAATKN